MHVFGSAANGLALRQNNDVDVCLEVDGPWAAEDEELQVHMRGGGGEALGGRGPLEEAWGGDGGW